MSSTEWTIRITDANGVSTYGLWNARGQLYPNVETMLEEIATDGVDGSLQRDRGGRPREISISITYPHQAGGDINALDNLLGSYKGSIIRVTLRQRPGSSAVATGWDRLKCFLIDYNITGRFSALSGFGQENGSTRTTTADITLKIVGTFGNQG